VINNFNRNTGAITNETLRITPADYGAGLEFSPDGSKIYFSGQGNQVRYADTATGTITSLASSASWSMQLGPDGKIYTSPSGSTSVGVISNANGSPSYSTVALPGGASLFRGLSNIAWLNPNLPVITASTGCPTVSFSYAFKNYFNTAVSVVANSEEWDFDEGSGFQSGLGATPSHTFATVGTYNVRMKVKDATCNQYWLDSVSVTLSCSLPVSLLNFTGNYKNGQTALQWSTASETNNNYFEVQRSNDGIHFYTIGKVKGNGTTLSYSSYSYTDNGTTNEIMYYRLIQYDLDGKNTYSNTIAVNPGLSAPVVSPNPFSNSILVSFQSEEPVQLKVLDILGRVVETKTMEQNSITLGESLNKGSYIISVNTSTENYYYRVIKE
ncbi:MAG TPA: T9SS type A sorting domain-containing protein, partial [Cytophagaceae bacterium]|nr:T9SS type A sorting domain-containing protein [Cytophagaceae bacterium]